MYIKKKGDYLTAISYFERSIKIAEEAGNKNGKATALNGLGNAYISLRDYDQAERYNLESLRLGKELKALQWQTDAYQALSLIYEKTHREAQALEMYKNYIIYRDSVVNDTKKQEIAKKEMQYEFEKKEVLLKSEHDKKEVLSQAEINRQRIVKNSIAGGAGILLMASLSSFIFYKRRRDAEAEKKEAKFQAQVSDTEMKALRSQMNPHFIFNSLNSVSDYISRHDIKAADNYLTKFARVMRMILENSEKKEVPLADDLRTLEIYMQLESLRMNHKFTYEIKVDDTIDQEATLIPPLILQPFVENSIWHGISGKQGIGKILIHIKKEGEMINCIVEDNGIGRAKSVAFKPEPDNKEKKSLGLRITKARIDIINKLKKTNGSVELSDLEEGVRVEVKLPLELAF